MLPRKIEKVFEDHNKGDNRLVNGDLLLSVHFLWVIICVCSNELADFNVRGVEVPVSVWMAKRCGLQRNRWVQARRNPNDGDFDYSEALKAYVHVTAGHSPVKGSVKRQQ